MDWYSWLLAFVLPLVVLWWISRGRVSKQQAREYWLQGARIIDVRSPAEFAAGHLPDAINVPLGQFAQRLPAEIPDRTTVLLLHCLSGGRSAIAVGQAKTLGYQRVFNLGSLARARGIAAALGRG